MCFTEIMGSEICLPTHGITAISDGPYHPLPLGPNHTLCRESILATNSCSDDPSSSSNEVSKASSCQGTSHHAFSSPLLLHFPQQHSLLMSQPVGIKKQKRKQSTPTTKSKCKRSKSTEREGRERG